MLYYMLLLLLLKVAAVVVVDKIKANTTIHTMAVSDRRGCIVAPVQRHYTRERCKSDCYSCKLTIAMYMEHVVRSM